MRFYFSSRSYPELREHPAGTWARGLVWLRAARHAMHGRMIWIFGATQVVLVGGGLLAGRLTAEAMVARRAGTGRPVELHEALLPILPAGLGILLAGLLGASWGGDLLRPHLRAVDEHARTACPRCGHDLADREAWPAASVPCPECGEDVPTSVFRPPFAIPRGLLAVTSGRGAAAGGDPASAGDASGNRTSPAEGPSPPRQGPPG